MKPIGPELKIAIVVENKGPRVMWAPVHCESHLLPLLEGVLHPETVPQECREIIPENAQDLLRLILASLRINWEDIPDPGAADLLRS
jgi:hypothetical protein